MLNLIFLIYLFNFIIINCAQFQSSPLKANLYHINPIAEDQPTETLISELKNPFNFKSEQIKIVIHGWMAYRDHITVTTIKSAYLSSGHDALFMADWSEAAGNLYLNKRYLIQTIGLRLAKLIAKFIRKNNIDPSRIHIIGHSLGSHVAGNIGDYFNGTIGRITGLDPAGSLFKDFITDGLLPKHATFVDCIHTDVQNARQLLQMGHVDFYPNYGRIEQPGCDFIDLFSGTDCNFLKAPFLYAESILLPHSFVSFKCSIKNIYRKQCYAKKAKSFEYMGEIVSNSATGTYFLRTNKASPYGMGSYSVAYLKLIRNNNTIEKPTGTTLISTSLADSNVEISKRTTGISEGTTTETIVSPSESPDKVPEESTDNKLLTTESQTNSIDTEPPTQTESTESETSTLETDNNNENDK